MTFVGQETHPTCESSPTEKQAREFVEAVQREDEAEIKRLEKLLNQPALPRLGAAALWYAKRGWPVFPCLPNGKQPHIKNGFYQATTDLQRIKDWWDKHPDSNIGLPTGHHFDVIDLDGPEGLQSIQGMNLPEIHGKVSTPRGFHLYILPTGKGNRAGIKPGVDYRGEGGYVMAPPSQLDLKRWSWVIQPSPAILKGAA